MARFLPRHLRSAVSRMLAIPGLAAPALAVCMALLCTTDPARSAEADGDPNANRPQLAVQIDAWWATLRNAGVDYAFVDPSGALSGGGDLQTIEHQRTGLPRLHVAWSPSAPDAPEVVASVWEYDDTSAAATGEMPLRVGALLASPDFAIGRSLVDSAAAESRTRATAAEVLASWEFGGSPRRLRFGAGVGWMRFERALDVTYLALRNGVQLEERVALSSDAQGVGPVARLRFDHALGRRVHLGGEIGIALPMGEVESAARDASFAGGTPDRQTEVRREGTSRAFLQYDLALLLDVHLVGGWNVEAAWQVASWAGVLLEQRFVDDVSQNTTLAVEGDAVFEGGRLGLAYRF